MTIYEGCNGPHFFVDGVCVVCRVWVGKGDKHMNSDQYHLSKIAEECAEVAQRAMKAQQFGLEEVQKGQSLNNLDRLVLEFHNLFTTFDNFLSLCDAGIDTTPTATRSEERLKKMGKFLDLSKSLGQVDESAVV